MTRIRRILGVTAGLAVAGAVTGAICGVLALTPLLFKAWPPRDSLKALAEIAVWAASAGALLGAVCGPLVAWSLLRHVPLWRVIFWAAIGTVVGAFGGWALGSNPIVPGLQSIFAGALTGMTLAGVGLRLRVATLTRRLTRSADRPLPPEAPE